MNFLVLIFALVSIIGNGDGKREAILGGNFAKLGQFPYSVLYKVDGNFRCGGALISTRHVVTAGHCIEKYYTRPWAATIYTGAVNRDSGGDPYKVKKMILHPNYSNKNSVHNDIAVLQLETDVKMTEFVSVVRLPTRYHLNGEYATTVGFGATTHNNGRVNWSSLSNYLKYFRAPIVENSRCNQMHETIYNVPVSQGQICTFIQRNVGTCFGDSGSPVVTDDGELVGVVSYGKPCAIGYPDVHTSVYYHINFIRDNMGYD